MILYKHFDLNSNWTKTIFILIFKKYYFEKKNKKFKLNM